ncbi:MAG: VCBS repeat-containing protein [Pyrinomonadaceae bacterium]
MASNSWLPKTDPLSGKKTGWFGKELPKNASSTWNPLAAPPPSPTPQLSKEYVYAGSRLLAVEDANANAAPPADLAVWRPSDGNWHVLGGTGSAAVTYNWGVGTDKVAQGDYDGDGKTDFAIYRPSASGQFYVVRSSDGSTTSYQIGSTNDLPAPGDYDGDGKTDYALYRPSDGSWYVVNSSTGILSYPYLGVTGTSAPADYDGDGKADAAVLNGSTFTARLTSNGQLQTVPIGSTGTPVSADYDGDGKANYSVRSGAGWIIANATLTPQSAITPSGDQSTDIPVQNDYDGDGKVDIAVWRPSTGVWYIRQSSNSQTRTEAFGMTGDIPVAAYYRR